MLKSLSKLLAAGLSKYTTKLEYDNVWFFAHHNEKNKWIRVCIIIIQQLCCCCCTFKLYTHLCAVYCTILLLYIQMMEYCALDSSRERIGDFR